MIAIQPPDEIRPRRAFRSDPVRLRRESRSESAIGAQINAAAAEADARVARALSAAAPPVTEAEAALIASSAHEPARLFTTVTVTDLTTGEQERYVIVPHDEGDLARGRISLGSPIARALLEEYPGGVVEAKTPGGRRLYRILHVQP